MKSELNRRDRTRRAILDALAAVIAETGGLGFSVQQVAERAGVTHRTVYNHFPTRDALNDALAEHVERVLESGGYPEPRVPTSSGALVPMIADAYAAFQAHEAPSRAYVMLMLASRRPARVWRRRTSAFEAVIARDTSPPAPLTSRGLTAAVRMFLSTTGWHILTEQMGLSPAEAATTATWAAQTLLAAASRPTPAVATKTKNTRKSKMPRGSR
jgi:AcrR family transcriptional regulator